MKHRLTLPTLLASLAVVTVAVAEEPSGRASAAARVAAPTSSDLARFTKGIPGRGTLHADIVTNRGTLKCVLHEDSAPLTVANFVGLARGLQPWFDPGTKKVVRGQPYYDDVAFHRVIKGFVIQAGDRSRTGSGGPGYQFADEIDSALRFDAPGRLAMANAGHNTNGSQFFVSLGAHPHLDGGYTIFGQCDPTLAREIGNVPVHVRTREASTPDSPVVILEIRFQRR